MSETQKYRTLCCREQWLGGIFDKIECRGDALGLADGAYAGAVCLPPVDSGEAGFAWGRLRLLAEVPAEASVRVYARASDQPGWPEREALWGRPLDPDTLERLFGPPAAQTDMLLQKTGRWLWVALELTAGGPEKPRVDGLSLWMAGDHMVDYLPAIYRGQDFTWRYLSIFNTLFQGVEEELDGLPRQLDPASAGDSMVEFLARWLCMEPEQGEEHLRERLAGILEEYETMYTVEGVRRTAARLTGQEPFIIEHFAVDPNDPACRNPALYRRLYGEDPYRFFLLLPQGTFEKQQDMERFIERMGQLTPAETEMELVLLKPCIQLDWHTYLGINSRIGDYIPAAIDDSVTIHYDTTIGGAYE